jgi:hypothetical protein
MPESNAVANFMSEYRSKIICSRVASQEGGIHLTEEYGFPPKENLKRPGILHLMAPLITQYSRPK